MIHDVCVFSIVKMSIIQSQSKSERGVFLIDVDDRNTKDLKIAKAVFKRN